MLSKNSTQHVLRLCYKKSTGIFCFPMAFCVKTEVDNTAINYIQEILNTRWTRLTSLFILLQVGKLRFWKVKLKVGNCPLHFREKFTQLT